jgi:hypothetical protein
MELMRLLEHLELREHQKLIKLNNGHKSKSLGKNNDAVL